MGLASIELPFHPCNTLRDNRRGVSRGNKNVGCGTWKRRFFAFAVRITVKLLWKLGSCGGPHYRFDPYDRHNLFLMNTLPYFLNRATITFVNIAVSTHILTSKQPAPFPPPSCTLNSITVTLSITTFQTINSTGSNRSRSLLLVLLLRLLKPHISLPFSNLSLRWEGQRKHRI